MASATLQIMKIRCVESVLTARESTVVSPSILHPCFLEANVLFDKGGGRVEGKLICQTYQPYCKCSAVQRFKYERMGLPLCFLTPAFPDSVMVWVWLSCVIWGVSPGWLRPSPSPQASASQGLGSAPTLFYVDKAFELAVSEGALTWTGPSQQSLSFTA